MIFSGGYQSAWFEELANAAVIFGANMMVQSTILLCVGLGAAYLLRGRGAAFQSVVLRTFLVAVLLCPVVATFIETTGAGLVTIDISLPSFEEAESGTPAVISQADQTSVSGAVSQVNTGPGSLDDAATPSVAESNAPRNSRFGAVLKSTTVQTLISIMQSRRIIYGAVTILWLLVASVLIAKLLLSFLYIRHIRHTAEEPSPKLIELSTAVATELDVKPPPVYLSSAVKSPLLSGVFEPFILFPLDDNSDDLTVTEIFVHELGHLKRRDQIWNLFHQIAVIALPFQPLVWLLSHWISETGDYVCDDFVVTYTQNHRGYAHKLFSIAQSYCGVEKDVAAGVGLVSFESPLRRRIKRILGDSGGRTLKTGVRFAVTTTLLCFCTTFMSGLVGFEGKHLIRDSIAHELISRTAVMLNVDIVPPTIDRYFTAGNPEIEDDIADWEIPATVWHDNIIRTSAEPDITGLMINKPISSTGFSIELSPASEESTVLRYGNRTPVLTKSLTRKNETVGLILAELVGDQPVNWDYYEHSAVALTINKPGSSGSSAKEPELLHIAIPIELGSDDQNDPDSKKLITMFRSLQKSQLSPVWSPDGKTIAFNDEKYGIWTIPVEGGEPELVYDNYYKSLYEGLNITVGKLETLCFSPDGQHIIFKREIIDENMGTVVDVFDDGNISQLAITHPISIIESVNTVNGDSRVVAYEAETGRISHDGLYFAFISNSEESNQKVVIINLINREERIVDCGVANSVCFSHDDSSLLVSMKDASNSFNVFKVQLENMKTEQLTFFDHTTVTDISSDGNFILLSDRTDVTVQKLYNIETGETHDLIFGKDRQSGKGRFSPDESKICFNITTTGTDGRHTGIYFYDLRSSGQETSVSSDKVPLPFKLNGNFPNPFNATTTIGFSLASDGYTKLTVYNIMGQKVRELVSEMKSAGSHTVVWDGLDDKGMEVSSGQYLSLLQFGKNKSTGRMTLMK